MSNSAKPVRTLISPRLRFFLGACIFCLGIHFLVNDLAVFNLNASLRNLPGKTASFRFVENDHQEDPFLRSNPAAPGNSFGLTQPAFNHPIFALYPSISPLFSPPKI